MSKRQVRLFDLYINILYSQTDQFLICKRCPTPLPSYKVLCYRQCKKSKRKVQGVPQSQTAALPRPQEEEETDKSKQAQTEQTYEKH